MEQDPGFIEKQNTKSIEIKNKSVYVRFKKTDSSENNNRLSPFF